MDVFEKIFNIPAKLRASTLFTRAERPAGEKQEPEHRQDQTP